MEKGEECYVSIEGIRLKRGGLEQILANRPKNGKNVGFIKRNSDFTFEENTTYVKLCCLGRKRKKHEILTRQVFRIVDWPNQPRMSGLLLNLT